MDKSNVKTGIDLMQEDFPSAPSSVFSRLKLANNTADSALDHAMQQLHVSGSADDDLYNLSGKRASPRPAALGLNGSTHLLPQQQMRAATGATGLLSGNANPYRGNLPSANASQYVPSEAAAGAAGQGNQQNYYVQQQPVYLDQNGQPVYYRMANQSGQYSQDMMYAADGSQSEGNYLPYNGAGAQGMNGGYYGASQNYAGNSGRMTYGQSQMGRQDGMDGDIFQLPVRDPHGMRSGGMDTRGRDKGDFGRGHNDFRDRDRSGADRNRGRDARGGYDGGGRSGNSSSNNSVMSNAVNPMRDPLVDEFRSTYGKSRQWGLVDLLGHVVAFCQDQHGSRFIQQKLEVCSEVDKQLIFDEIIPSAYLLMTDVFGNYVLQKLFEYGTPDQCENLAALLSGQCVHLSMQMYGCRVVQKALEYVSTPRLLSLVSEFESPPVLLRCVHDSNGNHVIQKCIEIVSKIAKESTTTEVADYLNSRIQFIIDTFKGRVKELSSHPYGCRVVQRILEYCCNTQKCAVLEELRECCSELVQDCYGNYVIQFVMQHGLEADRQVLIKEVQSKLLDFSQHKFASNVVEKCLQYANKRDRDEMIWTIINVTFDLNSPVDAKTGHCVLESMVRDPYANYVVQKVIDVSDERQRSAIMRYVRENIVQLRRYTYGKHILVRLEKLTNEKF